MTRLRFFAMLAVAVAVAVGAAACGGDGGDGQSAGAGGASGGSTSTQMDGETMEGMTDGTAQAGVESPAADLRVTLDRLLGEHAYLAMFATQKGFGGEKDFKAIAAALDRNSEDIGDAIGSVYGDEAKQKFLDGKLLWRDHINFFVDYTVGLAKDDAAAQKKAVGNLMAYNQAVSVFLSDATGLPRDALAQSFTKHITQLKGQIDAYSSGDYGQAYGLAREAYDHMFMAGDTIAGGITDKDPGTFPTEGATESAAELRVLLGNILGEHAMLAMVATQKGFSGSEDFEEIAASLDENTKTLGTTLASVYGDKAAEKFLNGKLLWRDHIEFFVDYTVGLAKKDKAAQKKAVGNLMAYNQAVSVFLSDATGLPREALAEAFEMHITQLKGQIDAYAAGNYERAYELMREAYAHMYDTATTLSAAIVEQNPDEFSS